MPQISETNLIMKLISIICLTFLVLALSSTSNAHMVKVTAKMGFLAEDKIMTWEVDTEDTYYRDIGNLYCNSVFPGGYFPDLSVRNLRDIRLNLSEGLDYAHDGLTVLVRCW